MNVSDVRFLAVFCSSLLFAPSTSFATNGYFQPGYGAKAIGLGGAGTAFPQDALAAAANPAGIAGLGTRLDIGVGLFTPPRSASVNAQGSFFGDNTGGARSENDLFFVPNMGFVAEINPDLAWGVAMYGNGLGTEYSSNFYDFTGQSNPVIGVELIQVLMPLSLAYKVTPRQSFGASLVLGHQRFRAKGLNSFAPVSNDIEHLTDVGYDYGSGYGYRVGWTGKISDSFTLGASYASKVRMDKFSEYRGLFAEEGGFDVPENYSIGVAFKTAEATTVVFDVARINYSGIPSVANAGPKLLTGDPLGSASSVSKIGALGRSDGMGFGWVDQIIYKLGVNHKLLPYLTVQAGINYGETPIPMDQLAFNVLAPATVEKHLALGAIMDLGKRWFGQRSELTVSYLHAFHNRLEGPSALGSTGTQQFYGQASFEMKQNQLEFSFGTTF